MASVSGPPRVDSILRNQRWTMLIVSTGGALETFDFVVYGFFARDIGRVFFPPAVGASSTMLSFAVFAIGYLSRPLGGVLMGHFGDKYGRRVVFAASAMIGAVATLAIGALPTYRSWGLAAPALLLTLRLVQGFCVGGELPGAVVYAVETTRARPGLMCGIVFFAVNLVLLLAAGINLFVQYALAPTHAAQYGWRIGFAVGGAIGLLSFVLRRTLPETNAYAHSTFVRHAEPLAALGREHWRAVASGVGATIMVGASNGLLVAHLPVYLQQLNYAPRDIAMAQTLYVVVISLCMLVTAAASDIVARRYVFRAGTVLTALFVPCFYVAVSRSHANLAAWLMAAGVVAAFANGTFACAIAQLFPIGVRYTGVGVALNVGVTAAMGTAPLIGAALVEATGWTAAPGLLMLPCAAISFVASFSMASSPAD